jgi:hypothetical protein
VKGKRGGIQDVFIDDFEISGLTQAQYWVTGVSIKPKKGKTDGKLTISYKAEGDADIAANWTTDLTKVQIADVYDMKFAVAAVKDKFNAASFDNGGNFFKMNVIPVMPSEKTDNDPMGSSGTVSMAGSGNGSVATTIAGAGGKQWIFMYNGNWFDPAGKMPLAIQDYLSTALGGTAATPRLVFNFEGYEANWKAFSKIIITYDLIATTCVTTEVGATGDGTTPSTNCIARQNTGGADYAGTTNVAGNGYPDLKAGEDQVYELNITSDFTVGTATGISFTKNHNGTGFLIHVKKVEYKY